jgi:uncharacterized phage-associated protein
MEKSKDTFSIKNINSSFYSFRRKEQKSEEQTISEKIPVYNTFPLESNEEENEISVYDVAAYIVKKTGQISTMKLQKLIYYCQAWSLVWDEKPMFKEKIEAWANGPVVRELFNQHKGLFIIESIPLGNPDLLDKDSKETVDSIVEFYGKYSAQQLIEMAHSEKPWKNARVGLDESERGSKEISRESMQEYYSSL